MTTIVWNTLPGPLGSLAVGETTSITLSATDIVTDQPLNYVLAGGFLPPGLTLNNSTGIISGTAQNYTNVGNSYNQQRYQFTIRAINLNTNAFTDAVFDIEVVNYTNVATLSWITDAGDLGTVSDGDFYSHELKSIDSAGLPVSYSFVSGELPPGLQVMPGSNYTVTSVSTKGGVQLITTSQPVKFFTGQIVNVRVGTNVHRCYIYMLNSDGADPGVISGVRTFVGSVPPGSSNKFLLYEDNKFTIPCTVSFAGATIVYSNGYLQGTPTLVGSVADKSVKFRFTVRATNSANRVSDRAFSLTVTNNFEPIINPHNPLPKADELVKPYFLGDFLDGTFYSQQLNVQELNPAVKIQWAIDSGELPPGITLSNTGLLSGYLQPVSVAGQYGPDKYDGDNYVGEIVSAGLFVPGQRYAIYSAGTTDFTQIGAPNNNVETEFVATAAGTGTGSAILVDSEIITAEQEYDYGPYDFNNVNQNVGYSFVIRAYDGTNFVKQPYAINVVARNDWRADSNVHVDTTYITVDSGDVYIPVILNATTTLPTGRSNSYYAYKFEGYDFEGSNLTYYLANTIGTFDAFVSGLDGGFDFGGGNSVSDPSETYGDNTTAGRTGVPYDSFSNSVEAANNLPGLFLDSQTGWLYGRLNAQVTAYETYTIGIYASKTINGVSYNSKTIYFTLPVLGDVNNTVVWQTPTDLGTIDAGTVSELSISAVSTLGKQLTYSIYDKGGSVYRLPQGLELLPSGEISGRVSFEAFDLDNFTTTFDGGKLTIDRTYNFTVQATSLDGTVTSLKEFTIKTTVVDTSPYVNLYLRAMPAADQRQIYQSVVNDASIFNPNLIYRPTDSWFGVNQNLEMLFLPGLKSADLADIEAAMQKNHYTKTYTFGDIKTAVVLDSTYNIKYEVVYIEVIDPEENSNNQGPGLELDLVNNANPYIDANGIAHTVVYPNTTQDMMARLVNNIGYENQNSLPEWMSSNQPDPTSKNKFKTPLGYTKAVVLCYTKPNCSNLIAYRLRNSGINFNRIQFTADRYIVDDFYSKYFSLSKGYTTAPESTFDALPNKNVGSISYTVNYGVTTPFDQINGRPLSFVQANGGIDGITEFLDGQTLIFVQQEHFNNAGPYDGWLEYIDLYIGDNDTTVAVEGYGTEGFDEYKIVPGFLENAQDPKIVNQRGGIWKIRILNGVVSLEFVQAIELGTRIRILGGKNYTGAIVYYSFSGTPGQSVPAWQVFKYQPNTVARPTTFNGGGTRFFSYRDVYYTPGTQDKYLKFPQYGVFN